jgi:hypothetical protein
MSAVLLISTQSCTKNFDKLNTNPSQFATPDAESILTGVFKSTVDRLETNNMTWLWEYSHIIEITGRYNTGDDNTWNTMYVNALGNLRQLKKLYGADPAYANRVAIANIWECYVYAYLVGTYGAVPYSQAGTTGNVITYDDENTIYKSLLDRLKQSSDAISLTGDKPTPDAIYGGDLTKWKKFANSLRLRIALRCQRNLPAESVAAIKDVMSNEAMLIGSDAENAKFSYGTAELSQSPYFITFVRNNINATALPILSDYAFTYFRSFKDPRLDAYFTKAATPFNIPRDTLTSTTDGLHYMVTYPIPHLGAPKSFALLSTWNLPQIPFSGAVVPTNFSRLPAAITAADRPFIIMNYAEVCFMKAEAAYLGYGGSQTADQYYYAGINANFNFYGITPANATAYQAQDGIKWGTAGKGFNYDFGFINTSIPADNLKKIWIQEWLNYYCDGGFDAWCLQRRTQNLSLPPHTSPGTPNLVSYLYADLPDRWQYPNVETTVNPKGVQDGIAKLGGADVSTTLLKIAAPYTHRDWGTAPAFLDYSFVQKWYGNNIQDLTAAGIKYNTLGTY